jgi:hypothetical protein
MRTALDSQSLGLKRLGFGQRLNVKIQKSCRKAALAAASAQKVLHFCFIPNYESYVLIEACRDGCPQPSEILA